LAGSSGHFIKVFNDADTFALAACFGLHNPDAVSANFLLSCHFFLELRILLRTIKCLREEIKIFGAVKSLHSAESFVE
jgi:hypothetical protein